jgi:hypothetical protein
MCRQLATQCVDDAWQCLCYKAAHVECVQTRGAVAHPGLPPVVWYEEGPSLLDTGINSMADVHQGVSEHRVESSVVRGPHQSKMARICTASDCTTSWSRTGQVLGRE